jgi:hypothetical protein
MEGGALLIGLWSFAIGILLLLLLIAVVVRGWLASRDTTELRGHEDATGQEGCPAEVASYIFSPADWRYVREMKAPEIERLFCKERRIVALVWVTQTSSAIRNIMREHAAVARQSSNLNPATELKIFLQFAALLTTCGAIRLGIDLAGPTRLGGIAGYAQKLFQQIAQAEQAFLLAAQERARAAQ